LFIKKKICYSALSAATTTAATTAATTTAATTGEAAREVEEVSSPKSPNPPLEGSQDEEEEEPVAKSKSKGKAKGKGKDTGKAGTKKDWSLEAAVEEEVIEWLKGNPYLWMRSKKGYKQKRAAWDMKAQELNISFEHLEQWWKNIKDWYIKLSKKTSGQAIKMLTERENWVLKHCGFYKGQYM
jgi:hypothetical protein